MVDLSSFVDQIKAQLKIKFLEIHIDPKFGSISSGHRENIRKNIVQTYSPLLSTWEKKAILDLVSLPVGENLFFSISHTKSIGGYAASDQRIGFDVEEVSRISEDVIKRTCKPEELQACPDIKLLWGAKESAFKRISTLQVVTEITIKDWIKISDHCYRFTAQDNYHGFICHGSVNNVNSTLAVTI